MIISIDGTIASGKSTISKLLSKKYGFIYINSGIFFRKVTYLSLNKLININYLNRNTIFKSLDFKISNKNLFTKSVDMNVSNIASYKYIRKIIYRYIKNFILKNTDKNILIEGRDVFFELKSYLDYSFFLDANFQKRLHRRLNQIKNISNDNSKKIIKHRDDNDKKVFLSKISKNKKLIKINTTNLSINDVHKLIKKKLGI